MKPCRALNAAGTAPAIPGRLVYGAEAVATRIRIAVQTYLGDWPDDTSHGLPIRRWVERPNTPLVEIEGTVRQLLEQVDGVVSVSRVVATGSAQLSIVATVVARVDGRPVTVRVGDLGDPRTPGGWFLLLPFTV